VEGEETERRKRGGSSDKERIETVKWRDFRGREDISGKVRKAKDTIRQITWRK